MVMKLKGGRFKSDKAAVRLDRVDSLISAIAGLAETSGTAKTDPAMSICPPWGAVTCPSVMTIV